MTYEQIKELIHLVSERHLHELEIERSGFRLKITGAAPAGPPTELRSAAQVRAQRGQVLRRVGDHACQAAAQQAGVRR
ncbi:MAG: hypothetical protein ABIV06_11140, partial [Thermoanaerobaculia bacterium]